MDFDQDTPSQADMEKSLGIDANAPITGGGGGADADKPSLLSRVLDGAATGAEIGSIVPGAGTITGGVIGGAASLFKGLYNDYEDDQKKTADDQQIAQALQDVKATPPPTDYKSVDPQYRNDATPADRIDRIERENNQRDQMAAVNDRLRANDADPNRQGSAAWYQTQHQKQWQQDNPGRKPPALSEFPTTASGLR